MKCSILRDKFVLPSKEDRRININVQAYKEAFKIFIGDTQKDKIELYRIISVRDDVFTKENIK